MTGIWHMSSEWGVKGIAYLSDKAKIIGSDDEVAKNGSKTGESDLSETEGCTAWRGGARKAVCVPVRV